MRRVAQLLAPLSVALLLLSSCHRETVLERAARQYREKQASRIATARLDTARFAAMTDVQMVRSNQTDGLGLALRPQKTELHVGEPLKLHLAYVNAAAKVSVSATTCQGFSLMVQDQVAGDSTTADITFSCSKSDPLSDNNVALPRGQLRAVDLTTADTNLNFPHPGQYIVTAGWLSFRLSDGTFLKGSEYSMMESNPLLITVR